MVDILHRVGIATSPEKIFTTLTTLEGNRSWWDSNATGDATKQLTFFKTVDIAVIETKTNELVRWKIVKGPAEWVDTEVTFRLVPKDKQTYVTFSHSKWREPSDFMHHCSTKWATFMLSLKALLETGQGRPAPNDVPIEV